MKKKMFVIFILLQGVLFMNKGIKNMIDEVLALLIPKKEK
jgi:hypothetical protein